MAPKPGPSTLLIPKVPDWMKGLEPFKSELKSIGRAVKNAGSLEKAVLGIITTWILNGVFGIIERLVALVWLAFGPLLEALGLAEGAVVDAFASVGDLVLGLLMDLQSTLAGLVGVAGPAAPLVGSALAVAVIWATYVGFSTLIAGRAGGLRAIIDLFSS